jgi:hypothetical protein
MLATLAGLLALAAGLVILLMPLLTPELARQRDAFWGAVVLLLGLTLATSSERLVGAPMLAVVCGGLLIGRLSLEVAQSRWRLLSPEERQALTSLARWQHNLQQLLAAFARLLALAAELRASVAAWIQSRRTPRSSGKRWVRQEADAATAAEAQTAALQTPEPQTVNLEPIVVRSLQEIDALIQGAGMVGSEAG